MKTEYQKNRSEKKSDNFGQINQYAKYSGLAFQMIAAILIGLWLGMKMDKWFSMKTPVFTAVLILLFIFASLYVIIRSLPKS